MSWLLQILFSIFLAIFAAICIRLHLLPSPNPELLDNFVNKIFYTPIAHRGGSNDAPENTICAFQKAVDKGVKVIEIDLQFTSDDVPVVIHDDDVDRTTNGKGKVNNLTFEEIKKLSAAAGFDGMEHCTVPSLDETMEFAVKNDVILLLDVKYNSKRIASMVKSILEKFPTMNNKFAIITFFPNVLWEIRIEHPSVITGFTRRHNHIADNAGQAGYSGVWQQRALFCLDRLYDFIMFYIAVPLLRVNMLELNKKDVCARYL